MSQKIWVIDDTSETQGASTTIGRRKSTPQQQKSSCTKNPVRAYSLSMIIWGGGQFYNGQWKSGILYLICMVICSLCMGTAVLCWDSVQFFFESLSVGRSGTLLICGFFYLSALIVWQLNAWHAYFRTAKNCAFYPRGISMSVLPAVCSFIMPGWGQILNGQVKKGFLFQVFALTGFAAGPAALFTFMLWPTLDASRSRIIIEWILSISVVILPLHVPLWIVSIIDAARVSSDTIRKEPLLKRMRYAVNRLRYRIRIFGWKNAVLPIMKRTALVMLLLIFCAITVHYVPRAFYREKLEHLSRGLAAQEMTVMPGIIEQLAYRISPRQ